MLVPNNDAAEVKTCFVCKAPILNQKVENNLKVNLPVCSKCKGSQEEILAVKMAIESLGEDFVCGCI